MLTLTRTNGSDPAFCAMIAELDEELKERYGAQMEFFGPHNHSADVQQALVHLSIYRIPELTNCHIELKQYLFHSLTKSINSICFCI